MFGQNTKAIALLFGQNWLIFITFQSAIKISQFQFRSFFAHFWPKYQGYSLTFWPNLAHFHHFSICNQNQSISISVIFRSVFAHFWPKCQGYSLTFWPKLAHFHHFSISNQNQSISISIMCCSLWPKYQGYSLTFWPTLTQCHYLSICNQNQSMSMSVIFCLLLGKSKAIVVVCWPKMSEELAKVKLIDFDCRLNSDENEPILVKK